MINCGNEDSCYTCSKKHCVNGCYNSDCSGRSPISDISVNGCENAHKCIGFISRDTWVNRQDKQANQN